MCRLISGKLPGAHGYELRTAHEGARPPKAGKQNISLSIFGRGFAFNALKLPQPY